MPGRPTINRKKDKLERHDKFKRPRIYVCKNCLESGHTAKTCKNDKVEPPPKVPAKIGRPAVCNPAAFQTRKNRGGGTSRGRGRVDRNVEKDEVVFDSTVPSTVEKDEVVVDCNVEMDDKGKRAAEDITESLVDITVKRGDSYELFEVVELEVEPLVDEQTETETYVDITRGDEQVEQVDMDDKAEQDDMDDKGKRAAEITESDSYASKFVKGKLNKILEHVEQGQRAAEEDYHVFCQGYNAPKRRKSERIAKIQKTIMSKDGVGFSEDKPFVLE